MRAARTFLISLIFLATGIVSAHADDFSRDSIFSKEWICLSSEVKSEGPISDKKIGEIVFQTLTTSKSGNQTTVKITGALVKVKEASWTGLNLFYAYKSKNYARKLIQFKAPSNEMAVNFKFTGTVPTKIARNVYFGVNLQKKNGGAACIKQSEYQKMLPTGSRGAGVSNSADPVIKRINKRISELPPVVEVKKSPQIDWYLENSTFEGFKRELMVQHQDLTNVYPQLYSWDIPAISIVGDLTKWRPSAANFSQACEDAITRLTDVWKRLPNLDNRVLGGTTRCDGRLLALFRPNPRDPKPNGDLMAQEIGGQIQHNAIAQNQLVSQEVVESGRFGMPTWYFQGGQTAIAYRTHAQVKKTLVGAYSMAKVTPECVKVSMSELNREQTMNVIPADCTYTKGFAAHQVLIALYGWDSITSWFGGFDASNNYEAAFLKTFKEPIQNFNLLVDEYWDYLNDQSNYPKTLSARLAK